MAKHNKPQHSVEHSEGATAVAEPIQDIVEAPQPKNPIPFRKYRVHLAANTPLAHRTAEFDAQTPEGAWEQFCELNGISGSSCEREITEVTE